MGTASTDDRSTHRRRPLPLRIAVSMFGAVLLVVGLAGLIIPVVPGWLLILPGLAILAGEFVWARRLLDGAKGQMAKARAMRRTSTEREAA